MRWLMDLLGRLRYNDPPAPPEIDREALRAEMKRRDPDFARISAAQHEQLQVVTARRLADGMAVHREAEFWTRHGHQK